MELRGRKYVASERCHLCGEKMIFEWPEAKMYCPNKKCYLWHYKFNIPYDIGEKRSNEVAALLKAVREEG